MHRTSHTFSVLQATAAIVGLAILVWSTGLPTFRIADAASLANVSNTLTDSAPGLVSDHTIVFDATSGVDALGDITITFPAGSFDLSDVGPEDIDLLEDGTPEAIGGSWTVATTSDTITISSAGVATIAPGATVSVLVGLNATASGDSPNTPDSQIINPTAGSYELDIAVNNPTSDDDSGSTRVAIVDNVTVTASVDTTFTFTVDGVAGGLTVNGTTTGASSTATTIDFGELVANTASTAAQDLTVVTNAANGFTVTVTSDGQLSSTNGADIDGFRNGNFDSTPVPWESPSATIGAEETYGHWGLTSDDSDYFGSGEYVSASTTPVEIFAHTGPTDGSTTGEGTTRVGYTAEISALQEAANDYTATLTYVATPVF